MKEMKKSAINGLKKDFRADDKLEKLVIDYAIRKTTGSRKDLNGVYYSKNGATCSWLQRASAANTP